MPIAFQGVSKLYNGGSVALEDVTFRINPGEFITLVGRSGAGKSTIVRSFLKRNPTSKLITSFTTRSSRDSDLVGEYDCNLPPTFFEDRDKFLWVVSAHGNTYGTTKDSVRKALFSILPEDSGHASFHGQRRLSPLRQPIMA